MARRRRLVHRLAPEKAHGIRLAKSRAPRPESIESRTSKRSGMTVTFAAGPVHQHTEDSRETWHVGHLTEDVRVERLERVVVHVEEALRLAGMPDEAHQRLALMLLDSAAELLLHRACERKLQFAALEERLLEAMRDAQARGAELDEEDTRRLAELESTVPSPKQRKQIERYFDAKAEFLESRDALDRSQVRVLAKLHRYRNEAYHRDTVRDGSLASAVRIYGYLVCSLLRDLDTDAIVTHISEPPGLRLYMADARGTGLGLRQAIATQLLQRPEIAGTEDLGLALAAHLDDRLQGLWEDLDEAAGSISDSSGQDWDEDTVMRWLQMNGDGPEAVFITPDQLRARKFPVTSEALRALRQRGQALAHERNPLAAFAEFADIEDAFEPLEQRLQELLVHIDHAVQLEIDRLRGK